MLTFQNDHAILKVTNRETDQNTKGETKMTTFILFELIILLLTGIKALRTIKGYQLEVEKEREENYEKRRLLATAGVTTFEGKEYSEDLAEQLRKHQRQMKFQKMETSNRNRKALREYTKQYQENYQKMENEVIKYKKATIIDENRNLIKGYVGQMSNGQRVAVYKYILPGYKTKHVWKSLDMDGTLLVTSKTRKRATRDGMVLKSVA